jgi:hypothetical protein
VHRVSATRREATGRFAREREPALTP